MKYADLRLHNLAFLGNVRWLLPAIRRVLVYGSAVVIAIVVSGGIFTFTPLIGISLAHTQGTSMEPRNKPGDLVLLKQIDGAQAGVSDVVVFEDGDINIMHRVIERYTNASGELMLVTKGDNEQVADHPILASQVSARLVTEIPLMGDISRLVQGKGGFHVYRSIVISFAVFFVAVWGIATSAKAERRPKEPLDT